jgi:predicted ATPase
MTEGPLATYRARQRAGEIDFDPMQEPAAEKLQSLHNALAHYRPSTGRAGWKERLGLARRLAEPPQGLYLFGPLGAGDHLALARRFHTLVVDDVPRMGPDRRNQARRFMTLVDVLYEHRVNLVLSAEAPPEALYPEGESAEEFQRTVSRLTEMQSKDYITTAHAV